MSEHPDLPAELEELDRSLRGISFRPRASLEPEVLGRMRRGEHSRGALLPRPWRRKALAALAAVLMLAAGAAVVLRATPSVVVDRCCYDLDGGGQADDGVLIHAQRNARVHRLVVYEDRDGSRSYTPADLIRLDRGAKPSMQGPPGQDLVTIERCCLDFDGGGPDDDGLLVIGVPPDRVVMAAIYETGRPAKSWLAGRPPRRTLR